MTGARRAAAAVAALLIAAPGPALAGDAPVVPAAARADRTARAFEHVQRVLFGALASSSYTADRVNRWTGAAVVGLYGGDAEDMAELRRAVDAVRPILAPVPIRIRDAGADGVNVAIIFAPRAEIPDLARANGMRADLAALGAGYTETVVRADDSLSASITLIRDELTGAERAATLVHEFYHALGPGGHSAVFRDSVIYAGGDGSSTARRLAPVDIKLLGLLYGHLSPGDGPDAVRTAFDAYWASLDGLADQYKASISEP